jgi:hypothetical protein
MTARHALDVLGLTGRPSRGLRFPEAFSLARDNVDAQTTADRKLFILRACPDLAEFLEAYEP